jgi:hypothetical protein
MKGWVGRAGKAVGTDEWHRRGLLNVDRRSQLGQMIDKHVGSQVMADIRRLPVSMSAIAAMHKGMTRIVAGILIRRNRGLGRHMRANMYRRVRTPFGKEEDEKEGGKNASQLSSLYQYLIKVSHRDKYSHWHFDAQEIGPTAAFAHHSMQARISQSYENSLHTPSRKIELGRRIAG